MPNRSRLAGWSWRIALMLGLSACASLHAPLTVYDPPRPGPVRAFAPGRPVVALVLSGGAARGFAHIGVIKVLQEIGIEPDLIVGTSSGALVAAAYASGMDAQPMIESARSIDGSVMRDFTIPNLGQPLVRGELGFVRGERLQTFVDRMAGGRPIEALPRRLAIVATDLQTGKPVTFTQGNTGLAVRASASVPGIFVPPSIDGRLYTDGQVSSPVPVTAARVLGAEIVIVVDATFPPEHADIANTASVLFQSFTIATQRIRDYELGLATIVIRPQIKTSGQLGFADRDWIMAEGERAARAALPQLLALKASAAPTPARQVGR